VDERWGGRAALQEARARLLRIVGLLLGLFLVLGALAALVFRVPLGRGLYLTVVTMSTLGDSGLKAAGGLQEGWVALTVLSGVVFGVAAIANLTGFGWADYFRAVGRERMLKHLDGHVIVAGGGRVGRRAALELRSARRGVLVVERSAAVVEEIEAADVPCLHGDATDREVLERAGLQRAAALIAALQDDAANLYVVSLASDLRPGLPIAARATEPRAAELLQRAGATRVVLPELSAGRHLAAFISRPTMAELMEDGSVEEIRLAASSPLCGKCIADVAATGFSGTVAAVKRDGRFLPGISGDTRLAVGDILLLVGDPERLTAELPSLIG